MAARTAAWARRVARISELLDAFVPPADAGPWDRFVIVSTDFHRRTGWGWVEVGLDAERALRPSEPDLVFEDVLDSLGGKGSG